ncbi:MAG: hypothetical protein RLY70_4010 [Planctomycetota bacterium]
MAAVLFARPSLLLVRSAALSVRSAVLLCTTDISSVAILSNALAASDRRSCSYDGRPLCTTDILSVAILSNENQSVPGTDRSFNTPACPIHLVYRRAAGDGRAGHPIPAEQTNPCQALIADRSAASRLAGDRSSRLYDGHLVRRDPVESVVSQPAIGRVTFGELRSPRAPAPAATDKNQSVPGTDRSSNTPACPIHLVYRRAAGDGRAGHPIPAEQTNQYQAQPISARHSPLCCQPVGRRSVIPFVRRTSCPSRSYREHCQPAQEPISAKH